MSERFPSTSYEEETPKDTKGRARKFGSKLLKRFVERRETRKQVKGLKKELGELGKQYIAEGKAAAPGTEYYDREIELAQAEGRTFDPYLVKLHESAMAEQIKADEYNLAWDQAHATKALQDENVGLRGTVKRMDAVSKAIHNGSDDEVIIRDANMAIKDHREDFDSASAWVRSIGTDASGSIVGNQYKIRKMEDAVAQQHAGQRENELR